MGRIERAPDWILKYKERLDKGTIALEDILDAENKMREKPIKVSSVTRAINAMGYPITGLRRGQEAEAGVKEKKKESVKTAKGPDWLQKYRERIEKGTITVEDILEEENRIRKTPIKLITVTRAINTMGYSIAGLRRGKKAESAKKREEQRGPDWLQKYREGIEKGTITVEDILEAESKIREKPIKMTTMARAINTMGYSIAGLRRGKKAEPVKEREEQRGPDWLQKYRERIEKGTITVEDILEAENRIRKVPIKLATVTRAINTMGYPITGLRREKKEEAKKEVKPKKAVSAVEAVDYSSSIGKISKATEKRFLAIKKSWEKDLDKPLHNDYFVNILLALAKLVEHGKTLTFASAKIK
ncbi:MAG: hypothetical protein N2V78_09990 [Methanophagales archaeon]|nr:hypothetical protein [Methanophagales archaeon]